MKLNALKQKPGKFMTMFSDLYQKDEKKFGDLSLTGILPSIDFTKDKDIHEFLDLLLSMCSLFNFHLHHNLINLHQWVCSETYYLQFNPCSISQNSFFFLIRKVWGNRGMVKKTRKRALNVMTSTQVRLLTIG
jgi:hypothetical protein